MKKQLIHLLKDPRDKLLAIDMDGTICEGQFWGEGEPKPRQEFIDQMWKWYKGGAHIVIYTARQPRYYPATHAWLIKNEVPFHGIAMLMKPGADVYIDDKALNIEDICDSECQLCREMQSRGVNTKCIGDPHKN